MPSWKAKKGNPFERLIAYNLTLLGYNVNRIDDNTEGIDLLADKPATGLFIIECKFHKSFSWNEMEKVFNTTEEAAARSFSNTHYSPIFIFKSNRQPILVAHKDVIHRKIHVTTFHTFFHMKDDQKIQQIPKGYKVWKSLEEGSNGK